MLRCGTAAGSNPGLDLLLTDHFVQALEARRGREAGMATGHAAPSAAAAVGKSDGQASSARGTIVCALVVVLAMASLWVGLSGLMNPDHAGGLARTLGGV